MSNLELVQIGIVTKNRWKDLELTLQKIADFGLAEMRIVIIDDHSDISCPFDSTATCRNVELIRMPESRGYILRRNEVAQKMTSKYYLSLDDDSFPTKGSLEEAVQFAENQPDMFCLAFPIYNPVEKFYQLPSASTEPYEVRFYVGCAHLLRLEPFLKLGGYRPELIHQGEEMEVSARAFQNGLKCWHYPKLLIDHTASLSGRSFYRMDFYGARNQILWNDWYVPSSLRLYRQLWVTLQRVSIYIRTRRVGHLKGVIAGFSDIGRYKNFRTPMGSSNYRRWMSLPPF